MRHYLLFIILFVCSCYEKNEENKVSQIEIDTTVMQKTEGTLKDTIDEIINQEKLLIFNNLNKKEILFRLFDKPEEDYLGFYAWKPNYLDLITMSIPLSYDSKFHTSLDTILYFKDTRNRNCAVAIFSTYEIEYDKCNGKYCPTGCHFCGVPIGIALFSQEDNKKWKLYEFSKKISQIGYFGEYKRNGHISANISLKEIGDKWTCLVLDAGLGRNGGYLEGGKELFAIEEYGIKGYRKKGLNKILSIFYGFKEEYLEHNEVPDFSTIKKTKSYYDLRTLQLGKNEILITKNYSFSQNLEEYIEK